MCGKLVCKACGFGYLGVDGRRYVWVYIHISSTCLVEGVRPHELRGDAHHLDEEAGRDLSLFGVWWCNRLLVGRVEAHVRVLLSRHPVYVFMLRTTEALN